MVDLRFKHSSQRWAITNLQWDMSPWHKRVKQNKTKQNHISSHFETGSHGQPVLHIETVSKNQNQEKKRKTNQPMDR